MTSGILVLNAGSSSLKFAVFRVTDALDEETIYLRGQIAGIGGKTVFTISENQTGECTLTELHNIQTHQAAIDYALHWIKQNSTDLDLIGVGHRVVHGGSERQNPALLDDAVLEELDTLCPLAPHHQPHNLAAIRAVQTVAPQLPQIACFDTAFHASQDEITRMLPLPETMREQGMQRYGFHGLSYEYIRTELMRLENADLPERIIIAHLGNGASLCGLKHGTSAITSMGFSTLDGLLMGTRCGSIDPGILLHLLRQPNMDADQLEKLLYNQSGLLGVSGISSDMRVLLASESTAAKQAIELFCHNLLKNLGATLTVLGGLDALVFTGGIGEHAPAIRQQVCAQLGWLGLSLDISTNQANAQLISTNGSQIKVWVIPTNEELTIARHSFQLICNA